MKIAVDVMGGDYAPSELVKGAAVYLQSGGESQLALVGCKSAILDIAPDIETKCEIVDAPDCIEMEESPLQALRKKPKASVAVAAKMVSSGAADAFLSAGSTGAQMAASLLAVGRIDGIERPAISVMLPTSKDQGVLILDMGANVDCRASHLYQFAVMGACYYKNICNVDNPRVGILSIGAESSKGNELTKSVYEMLSQSSLNFIGNIEADAMYHGKAHVVVCDGFTGNVLLKASEGVSELIQGALFKAASSIKLPEEQMMQLHKYMQKFKHDAPEYSAAPLLGINGVSVVCHGKAKSPVIASALKVASEYVKTNVVELIRSHINKESPGETG